MGTRSNAKGSNFERLLVDYFRCEFGQHITRPRAGARHDRGDLAGVPRWTLEAKNYADLARGAREGLADLAVEQVNAGTPYGAVILKRHGKGAAADQLFMMRLGDAVPLIRLSASTHWTETP